MPTEQQTREVLAMLRDSKATAMDRFPYFNQTKDRYDLADLNQQSSIDDLVVDLIARNDIKEG